MNDRFNKAERGIRLGAIILDLLLGIPERVRARRARRAERRAERQAERDEAPRDE